MSGLLTLARYIVGVHRNYCRLDPSIPILATCVCFQKSDDGYHLSSYLIALGGLLRKKIHNILRVATKTAYFVVF